MNYYTKGMGKAIGLFLFVGGYFIVRGHLSGETGIAIYTGYLFLFISIILFVIVIRNSKNRF